MQTCMKITHLPSETEINFSLYDIGLESKTCPWTLKYAWKYQNQFRFWNRLDSGQHKKHPSIRRLVLTYAIVAWGPVRVAMACRSEGFLVLKATRLNDSAFMFIFLPCFLTLNVQVLTRDVSLLLVFSCFSRPGTSTIAWTSKVSQRMEGNIPLNMCTRDNLDLPWNVPARLLTRTYTGFCFCFFPDG